MSEITLILVLQIKTSKIINDVAKVQQKSEKITPFGGIFFVLDKFDSILSSGDHGGRNPTTVKTNWCFVWSNSKVGKMIRRTDPMIYIWVLLCERVCHKGHTLNWCRK